MATFSAAQLTFRQTRRGMIGWLLGVAGITALYVSSYKSVSGAKAAAISGYPPALKRALNLQNLSTPSGYLAATAFGIPMVLIVSIYAIGAGTRSVAGDEEAGVLDLLLAYPLTRSKLVVERAVLLAAVVVAMGATVEVVIVALRGPTGLTIGIDDLTAATVSLILLGWCLGGITLFVSAALGRRGAVLATSAGIALFLYLASSFLPLVGHFAWTRHISPYAWHSDGNPLHNGWNLGRCALLAAVAFVATAGAAYLFGRRDLRA